VIIVVQTGCEKNTDSAANKAFLSITHVAPNVLALDVYQAGIKLTTTGKISYGSSSGMPGDPYLAAVSGTHTLKVTPNDSLYFLSGNIFMQSNLHYSMFIYDTLQAGKVQAIILEDALTAPVDTLSAIRFLNFVNDTTALTVVLLNSTDTVSLGSNSYVGYDPTALKYSAFGNLKSGRYNILIGADSTLLYNDSLILDGGKMYTVYSQGLLGSIGLSIGKLQHN
jgi:hypothetical protein